MLRTFMSALLLGNLLTSSVASARTFPISSDVRARVESPADVLRSAFYLRAAGRDSAAPFATPSELNGQLRRHFDLVLAALASRGGRSLEVALKRLERSRGELWSDDERAVWRQTLARRRALNIVRLRLYQLRGRFPQNEHTAGRAVPIFVDNHDTACAVGHLMRESGWGDAVAAIERTNNFVYVTDVRDGPIVDWVLVSGLTQEEAALIQPSYIGLLPPYHRPAFDARLDVLAQDESITKNGLHFDNFHFIAGELTDPDSFPVAPPPSNQVNLTDYGAAARDGVFMSIVPVFDNWLFVGASGIDNSIYDRSDSGVPWGVAFSYDVAAVDPESRLVAASVESFVSSSNFGAESGLDVQSWIYPGGAPEPPTLAHLALDEFTSYVFLDRDSAWFAPQQKITIVTAVKIEGGVFTSMVHSFQKIPEPGSAVLGILALFGVSASRRRC